MKTLIALALALFLAVPLNAGKEAPDDRPAVQLEVPVLQPRPIPLFPTAVFGNDTSVTVVRVENPGLSGYWVLAGLGLAASIIFYAIALSR